MKRLLVDFHEYVLQKVKTSGMYQIEKILKSRTLKGKRQLPAHWLGFNSDFDSLFALKTFTMARHFYLTLMSNVYIPLYDDLNETSDLCTKLFPAIKFGWKYDVTLVDCFLKNIYVILRKDRTYDIKVRQNDSPVYV